ncbi:alpha/beta hydrolase [Alishewanella sp. 16-MA]|uniref:Alpha/beta hydrolase n=1 Tax=Alishewanella maricola TaxID=2795740 RepID=A0ABS8C3P7_9ALTE|nr:alpha/beta hydrolase [Alishewanella maricola]MCB5226958.1 alpha/beta hydrolase [Alishewanella maricola]
MRLLMRLVGALCLVLVIGIAIYMALYREPDRSVEQLRVRWAPAPSQFVDVAGMQLHLRDEGPRGDPTPIVLIHGTSSSLHTWDGWVNALKDERRVIRFDLPGFGLTGPSADNNYSIENYARIVIALLDELQLEQVVIAGNSLGGNVAWATAVLYPQRIKKLVLVDAIGYPNQAQSVPIGFTIARIPLLNKLMEQVLPRSVIESSVKNVYGDPALVTAELIDRYFELTTRAGNRQALSQRLRQTQTESLVNRIKDLKLPTLIIWGDRDRLIPPAMAVRFHQDIVGSQLVRFNRLGHVPQEEDPSSTVTVFKQFLADANQTVTRQSAKLE